MTNEQQQTNGLRRHGARKGWGGGWEGGYEAEARTHGRLDWGFRVLGF